MAHHQGYKSTYLYSAPQPFTKLIRIVHILVSWYTASKPWLTDCDSSAANSWLLKIFKLQPMGKIYTKPQYIYIALILKIHYQNCKRKTTCIDLCILLHSIKYSFLSCTWWDSWISIWHTVKEIQMGNTGIWLKNYTLSVYIKYMTL